jgi:hypothetical protein
MSRSKVAHNLDLRTLSRASLQERIQFCAEREASAKFNKGRRSWKQARQAAEAELERRMTHDDTTPALSR